MKKNKVIIFDFDGVIVDSCRTAFEINKEMISDLEYEDFQAWQNGNFFTGDIKRIKNYDINHFLSLYKEKIPELLPVKGMEEVFKELRSMGYNLIVVSSSADKTIEDFLKKHSLKRYFVEIMGKDTSYSKVEKFKMIFKKYGIRADETLMITDSTGDIEEAMEVKIKSIGVIWGIHEMEKLKKVGADFIAEKSEDILVGVKKLLALN